MPAPSTKVTTGTASAAFRLLSQPSGTYNKVPGGLFAAGLPAVARGALGAFTLPGLEDPNPRAPSSLLLSPSSPSISSLSFSISSLSSSLPTLYEFQACPFCRKVREAATLLALDVLFLPCPKEGTAFRPLAAEAALAAGKQRPQFPLLQEEEERDGDEKGESGKYLFESDAIVQRLFEKYGPLSPSSPSDAIPWQLRPGNLFAKASLAAAAVARAGRGRAAAFKFDVGTAEGKAAAEAFAASRRAMRPLVLWGYEPSPYCTLVREKLNELELPHVYRLVPRGAAARRSELVEKWAATAPTTEDPAGRFQVPYLEDPNNGDGDESGKGAALYETGPILGYLDEKYGPKKRKK